LNYISRILPLLPFLAATAKRMEPRHHGWWVEVRRHPPKLLPIEWGIWKPRYCITEPANVLLVRYFKEEPIRGDPKQEPEEVILCDNIQFTSNPRIAVLGCAGRNVAWLSFPDMHVRNQFAGTLKSRLPENKTPANTPCRKHRTSEEQTMGFTVMKQTLEQQAAELGQKQTELADWEASLHAEKAALRQQKEQLEHNADINTSSCSAARPDGRFSSSLCSPVRRIAFEEDSSDEELPDRPFGSSVVMDWPLSKSEKQLRLVSVLDKQRIVSEQKRRAERRRSAPPATPRCHPDQENRARGSRTCN